MKEKSYCIYIHINKINNKVYIGQTCQEPEKRWGTQGSNYKRNPYFWSAIQKYGWENFEHNILERNLSLEEANEREQYWIKYYNSTNRNKGYNSQSGGNNYIMSEEQKKKISNALIGKPFSEEHKKNLSEAEKRRVGELSPFYGKHHSDESKEKMRQAKLGTHLTEIHKQHISEAVKGENHPNWGKHLSAETKSKIGKGGVICIETGKYYCSSNEAAKDVGLKSGAHIRDVCRGERKTAGKYHWKYAEVN